MMRYADKRVLIIEDQRPFLLLLRGLLNSMGATDVVTKSSAEQAISLCRKQKFDIIISDLHLGGGKKNGFELIEELRVRHLIKPSAIFVLISADSARPVVLGSLERRPDDYLVKPFSQAQLKTRLSRAWQKRQGLLPIYEAMAEDNLSAACERAKQLLAHGSPYKGSLEQLLVELYWKQGEHHDALKILSTHDKERPVLWVKVALARTYLNINEPEKALAVCREVLELNRFSADAYDIMAESQNLLNDGSHAVSAIRHAIKLSPFSLPRHYVACSIARDNDDYELATESALAIWQLARKTIHQHAGLWCGYIRSILDAAENTEDKRARNRYQQEALLAMQRGRHDEYLSRQHDEFDIAIFEQIINARINSLDGKLIEAKKNLASSQTAIDEKYDQYPVSYAPDTIKVMFDLGEYDEVSALLASLKAQSMELDPNSAYLVDKERNKAADNQRLYTKHNKQGIELYQQQQYEDAKEAFTMALRFAPVNTGVALNLLQCILKLLASQPKPEPMLIRECRRIYKLIDGMPMKKQHQQKYDGLKDELFTYIGK